MLNRRLTLVILAVVAMGGIFIAEAARTSPLTAYQLKLRSQVDTDAGAPRNGRDPAIQAQTSLAAAASAAVGNGLRTDTPAAAVMGDMHHHVPAAAALPNSRATGRNAAGCLLGFSNPGETCITASPTSSLLDTVLPKK